MVFNLARRPVGPPFAQVLGKPMVVDLDAAITEQNEIHE
jgi:hypothetical protein